MAEQNTPISPPVNGEAVITVLSDFSAAFMTLYPPQNGGKDISYAEVMAAIAAKSVKYHLDERVIRAAVTSKAYEQEFKIAAAQPPVHGKDGTITYKYSKDSVLAPTEDEHGFVDYKNLGLIRNINEGDPIADITLPGEGVDGIDIRGVTMKAHPGKKASFNLGSGTKLSEDGLHIVAAYDGHVCFRNNAFCVDSTVTINGDVDASVGNIDFIGDIIIKGEILEGFKVTSAKNITVSGNVTGAVVRAGGSVTVKKGCINSEITAHDNISCQFCEHSKLYTDSDLNIQSFVICDVYCGGDLKAKALNGGKYTIIGDTEITYLGTKNYTPTEIVAGDNALLSQEKEAALKQSAELDSKIDRCNQIIDFLNEKRKQLKTLPEDKEELLGNMVKTRLTCQKEKKALTKRIAEIDDRLSLRQYRAVICKGMVYPGAKVTIDNAVMKFENETPRVKIYVDDSGNIVTGQV